MLKFKNGSVKSHEIERRDQVKVLKMSFGYVIRVSDLKLDENYYYDFSILGKIDYEK